MVSGCLGFGPGLIGVCVENGTTRCAQVVRRIGRSARLTCAVAPLAEDNARSAESIRTVIKQERFRGRRATAALPSDRMTCRRLTLSPMPLREVAAAVHWQMTRLMNQPAGALITDYLEVPCDGDGTAAPSADSTVRRDVLASAAERTIVESHLASLESAGLSIKAIETGPAAIARCFMFDRRRTPPDQPILVIDLSDRCTTIMSVQSGQPAFIRTLNEYCPDGASGEGDQPAAEDIIREVGLCLHHLHESHGSRSVPTRGCIIARGSHGHTLPEALLADSSLTFVPVRDLMHPGLAAMIHAARPSDRIEAWMLPAGLALYGCEAALQSHKVRPAA